MDNPRASESNEANLHDYVSGEDQLLDSLRDLWFPHREKDLEVRYQMGVLLNRKLGKPTVRQSYGLGTIERVSKELEIDKSDISRMRRFAAKYDSFERFQKEEPEAKSWTKVRELVAKERDPDRPTDSRAVWGILRSVRSSIEAFRRDHDFAGPRADELRSALQELLSVASAKLNIQFDDPSTKTSKRTRRRSR
jgi:hypothetical protein